MKKLLLLLSLLVTICSCEPTTAIVTNQKQEYEGHKCISFKHGYSKAATKGIVHDPDCPYK